MSTRTVERRHGRARALAAVSFLALTALAVSACSNSATHSVGTTQVASGEQIKFGFIVQDGTAPFANDQIQAAKAQAAKDGVQLLTANIGTSDSLAISTEQEFIAQGAQGIIMVPPVVTIGPSVLAIAKAKNIPVIADEQEMADSSGKDTYFNGLDNTALGQVSGTQLAAILKAHPGWNAPTTALLTDTTETEPACNQRTQASDSTFLKDVGSFKGKMISVNSDDTLSNAITAAGAALVDNPGIKNWLVTSCNDDGVVGVLQAMASKGIGSANAVGWGMDGSLACTQLVKSNAFYGADYIDFSAQGVNVFNEMYSHLKSGTPLPAVVTIPAAPITRANYKQVAHC